MANAVTNQAYELAKQLGIGGVTIENIRQKAESGQAMQTPTAGKQAVYDAFQNHYKGLVEQKAQSGQQLTRPNDWKNDIYNKAMQAQATQNGTQGKMDIETFLKQSQTDSASKMASLEQYLQQQAQAQITSQQSQLAWARDQQLAQIDQALKKAIADGELSVREAEKQFQQAKEQIHQQAYVDSEHTNLVAHDRGIQNSAQMIGLMQGDQARKNSLINKSMTTRDEQINAINNQLKQMEYDANINKSLANSQFNYGFAGAQAEIYNQLYGNLANLSYEEFVRMQQQGADFQKLGLQQQFNRENMSLQQQYQLQQMLQGQMYNRENMQTEQNFALEKLSAQQKYTLEQMAKAQGYDLEKLSKQQQYQLAQMAQSFGYDMALQSSQQNFQAGENALNRNLERELLSIRNNHDINMLSEEQRIGMENYYVELGRKLNMYTPGTDEYKVLQAEADWAYKMAAMENQANFAAEIGATELSNLLKQYPTKLPDLSDKKAVDSYNAKVEQVNKQLQRLLGSKESEKYIRDLAKSKGKSDTQTQNFIKSMTEVMGASVKNIIKFTATP